MDKVKLAIQSGKVQDGDVLFEQLSSIQSNDFIEKISPEQFAELSEMVFLFQDDWMDNPLDYSLLILIFGITTMRQSKNMNLQSHHTLYLQHLN